MFLNGTALVMMKLYLDTSVVVNTTHLCKQHGELFYSASWALCKFQTSGSLDRFVDNFLKKIPLHFFYRKWGKYYWKSSSSLVTQSFLCHLHYICDQGWVMECELFAHDTCPLNSNQSYPHIAQLRKDATGTLSKGKLHVHVNICQQIISEPDRLYSAITWIL